MNSYTLIGDTSPRIIPEDWPTNPVHVGRADVSADGVTDPRCRWFEYEKVNCFKVRISKDEMARALGSQEFRGHGYMLKPFWIDVDARTVNRVPVKMDVIWRRPATGQATIDSSSTF